MQSQRFKKGGVSSPQLEIEYQQDRLSPPHKPRSKNTWTIQHRPQSVGSIFQGLFTLTHRSFASIFQPLPDDKDRIYDHNGQLPGSVQWQHPNLAALSRVLNEIWHHHQPCANLSRWMKDKDIVLKNHLKYSD